MSLIRFAECVLQVDHADRYIATIYADGSKAEARPNWTPDDVAMSKRLGYRGDCWQLCMDHECLHTFVGELFGFGHSVVLWGVAHDNPTPKWGMAEEGYNCSMAKYINTGESDDLVLGLFDQARERHGLYEHQVVRMVRGLLQEVRSEH